MLFITCAAALAFFTRRRTAVLPAFLFTAFTALGTRAAVAQVTLSGRVLDAANTRPLSGVSLAIEGTGLVATSDSVGAYRIVGVPAGPHVLRATRVGYAPGRELLTVPTTGAMNVDIQLARSALRLHAINVTADPVSRARGELGTASVIEREAIRNQMATSLAGVLELLPGVPLAAPGLDAPQQISLRAVPVSGGGFNPLRGAVAQNPSAQQLAAFGTQVVVDGVPVSNNANLQSLGPRSELTIPSTAGGGIDLRRIPAATIDRVEVIRGIPSARYGDLTQGVIIVDTRAGAFEPFIIGRIDANTREVALAGGRALRGVSQVGSVTSNFAETVRAPGVRDDRTYRLTAGMAHRLAVGGDATASSDASVPTLFDTRIDFFRVFDDSYNQPPRPDVASYAHDAGLRFVERARMRISDASRFALTVSFEDVSQRSYSQESLLRPAMPFTDRLTPGVSIGKFIGGTYVARTNVDGAPKQFYSRAELSRAASLFGGKNELRSGLELRREWASGPGYQFDIEFPPQVSFNGVQGFDRPRRYDAVPPLVTSALYVDDWITRALSRSGVLQVQGGLRFDVLHRGSTWMSGAREGVLAPRLNIELAPIPSFRLRAGAGRMTKTPSLEQLFPAPQYNDVINVNWYANNPAERLAVLTTSIFDPTNPKLGYSIADRAEVGLEADLGRPDAQLSVTYYGDRLTRGVGIVPEPTYLLRAHYQLTDSSAGTGKPPSIIQPPSSQDTVPIVIDRRANNLTIHGRGAEATLTLPEIPALRTRVSVQGSWSTDRLENSGVDLAATFGTFQLDQRQARSPYWSESTRTGELALLTTRVIHHQPAIGLVVTGTIQHTLRQTQRDEGGTDTLSWDGYITRAGQLVPVPASQRAAPIYQDLRILPRLGVLIVPQTAPVEWIFNLQVSKSLPANGRLSFYAFNAFDRVGSYGDLHRAALLYSPRRFGIEVSMPLALWRQANSE